MVDQYPDTLKFDVSGSTATEDENGDTVITPGSSITVGIKCRFEINDYNKTLLSNDGQQILYSWDVYAPLDQQDVPEGVSFKAIDKYGKQFASGVVKRFKRSQLNLSIQV